MAEIKEEEKLKLKKLIKELEKIKGRHTELISVYIPAGYNLAEATNQLFQEKGTASNIKSKSTRKNVLAALEKILQYLKLFRKTPDNGLVIFCGNVSEVEGKEDIKLWSYVPPVPISQKIYWCDQTFVLDPLRDLISEKEVYGLIVLDAREATIGLLKGKRIEKLKSLESTVPSKTVKGGMCLSPDTLIQLKDGRVVPIDEFKLKDNPILSCDFDSFELVFAEVDGVMKRKVKTALKITTRTPSLTITVTPEHRFFIPSREGIKCVYAGDIKENDNLMVVRRIRVKGKLPKLNSKMFNFKKEELELFYQFLGYTMGDGCKDGDRIILLDRDEELIKNYENIAGKLFGLHTHRRFRKDKGCFEVKIYSKELVEEIEKEFKGIFDKKKKINEKIQRIPIKFLARFIKGLFDAEGYVDKRGQTIGITMSSQEVIKVLQFLLLRFGIISSYGEDVYEGKCKKYRLRITDTTSLRIFKKRIGFSSSHKSKALEEILVNRKDVSFVNQIPISGKFVIDLVKEIGMNTEDFPRVQDFFFDRKRQSFPVFKKQVLKHIQKKLKELEKGESDKETVFKARNIVELLKKIYYGDVTVAKVAKIEKLKKNCYFYDISVPKLNNFIANGFIVHNSQKRYDRLRDDALNEFLVKVGEEASNLFLKQENLKGVLIGGPGPVKETFYEKNYLHYQIQKKVLGVKDIGSTDEYGLEELVFKAQDLLKEALISKEREIMQKFFSELKNNGNVVYGFEETKKALEAGAVDVLLLSEEFNWLHVKFKCVCGYTEEKDLPRFLVEKQKCPNCGQKLIEEESREIVDELVEKASSLGTRVEYISTETSEGIQFKELGGIGAFLRYKMG